MKIAIERILPNPHRNLARNPIRAEQVTNILESIERNEFWDNLVVREAPGKPGYYELAYGHHRMAAVAKAGITHVDFHVRNIDNWGMYQSMVDENSTQATITPDVVFENIGVGAHLLETFIRESATVEEFEARMGVEQRAPAHAARNGLKMHWPQIKSAVMAGEGVGKDLVQRYLPHVKSDGVVSTVLASIYGAARKAAADKRAAEAAEANRLAAEANRVAQAEAEATAKAQRKAEAEAEAAAEAQRKAERQDQAKRDKAAADKKAADEKAATARRTALDAEKAAKARDKEAAERQREHDERVATAAKLARADGIDEKLLRKFDSPTVMADFAQLVKRLAIPASKHSAAVDQVLDRGWSRQTMREQLPVWWDEASGAAFKRRKQVEAEYKAWKFEKRYSGGDLHQFCHEYMRDLGKLEHRTEVLRDAISHAPANLRHGVAKNMREWIARFQEIVDAAGRPDAVKTVDITPAPPKMLSHR